ncbi:hypothetical protein OESDEN_07486 [Oesophagostomum dentatum]|uniref:PABS domain-containing protein n=1 Tax=Oesophagostomum dentatum TaxID=61180 RepID=A0A0B1T513_OESDE|nr:hypothetical protein OESDEN_07486 [Oesophagostomum dentatum]
MDNPHSRVLLLGLKSGYIKSYLYKHFPNIVLTVVEKDREMLDIALTYFHMRIKSDYAVIIKDPVEYVNKAGGQKYDAIIIDVCKRGKNGKNPTCPMDEMYADQMVKKLASMLNRDGNYIS